MFSQPRVLKRRTQGLLLRIGRNLQSLIEKDSAKNETGGENAPTDFAAAQ